MMAKNIPVHIQWSTYTGKNRCFWCYDRVAEQNLLQSTRFHHQRCLSTQCTPQMCQKKHTKRRPPMQSTKAFNSVPLILLCTTVWAYKIHLELLTTVYMMHNVQHMYSAAHLKTGRNTITPSLFTCKVKQSNSYTRKITRHNSYSEQNFLKHSDWTVHCLCAPQWNANSNNLHNECEMRCGVSEDNSLRTSILCNKLPLYKSCMWKMWCNWKVKKEGGGGFIHGKVKGFVHCIYRLEMLDAEKKKHWQKGIYNAKWKWQIECDQLDRWMSWLDPRAFPHSSGRQLAFLFAPIEWPYLAP